MTCKTITPRFQKLLAALADGKPHTSLDLVRKTHLVAVGSAVSELRRLGYVIDCRFVKKARTGAMVYSYTLKNMFMSFIPATLNNNLTINTRVNFDKSITLKKTTKLK